VLASTIAKPFVEELKQGLEQLGRKPKLVGFLGNTDPAARMYAEWTRKTTEEIGFDYELRTLDKEELEEAILNANEDDLVDGIMVYFPVFGNRQDQYLQQVVSREKDVEGLSHIYISNMYHNIRFLDKEKTQKSILPCTPLAIVKILEYLAVYNSVLPYGNRLYGKTVTVVNRSEIVGRPLAALLANDGATVYSVDVTGVQKFTCGEGIHQIKHLVQDVDMDWREASAISDVIITGVPSSEYKFPMEYTKDGVICINFSSEKNFDAVAVKQRASLYVPSIGKVTIAMLLRNLLRLIDNRQNRRQR
jgi:methylenetetrahydrofolate dehydrogenase (NAD+)